MPLQDWKLISFHAKGQLGFTSNMESSVPSSPKRNTLSQAHEPSQTPPAHTKTLCHHENERRRRILDTACLLIQTQGYQKTTMDKIALHTGMSKKTLYLVFPSKKILMEQLLLERLFTPLNIETDQSDDLKTQLTTLVTQISEQLLNEKCLGLLRAIIGETTRSPMIAQLMADTFHLSGRKFNIQQWLITQKERGWLHFEDAQDAADHLFGLTLGSPMLARLTHCSPPRTEEQLRRFLKEGIRIFIEGCRFHKH